MALDLSEVPSHRTGSNGPKLNHKFHLNIGKSFCTLRVAEHRNSCPGGPWSFSMEIFQTHWMCPCVAALGDPASSRNPSPLSFWGQPWVLGSGTLCGTAWLFLGLAAGQEADQCRSQQRLGTINIQSQGRR